jgi:mono/diheme cytochrome c family protein
MPPKQGQTLFQWLVIAALGVMAVSLFAAALSAWRETHVTPQDAEQVKLGLLLYEVHCASCHGAKLEGQPNWRERLPNGRMPAPPHDATGHTWHHPDAVLFGITKEGLVAGRYAPPKYQSDMPAFGAVLSDAQIHAVLAYIKSTWPERERQYQREVNRKYSAAR